MWTPMDFNDLTDEEMAWYFSDEVIAAAPETPHAYARLVVEDRHEALFMSSEWVIVASVEGRELARSETSIDAHTQCYVEEWTKRFVCNNASILYGLNVDVDTVYQDLGGDIVDLAMGDGF